MLESNLNSLESKIDDLLKNAEEISQCNSKSSPDMDGEVAEEASSKSK